MEWVKPVLPFDFSATSHRECLKSQNNPLDSFINGRAPRRCMERGYCGIERCAIFRDRFHGKRRNGWETKRDEIFIFQALKHSERHGWVEQFEPPMFTDDGDSFLTILPQKQHDASYWRHAVAITNVSSGKTRSFALTSGRFVVTEIVSWDQKNSYL